MPMNSVCSNFDVKKQENIALRKLTVHSNVHPKYSNLQLIHWHAGMSQVRNKMNLIMETFLIMSYICNYMKLY